MASRQPEAAQRRHIERPTQEQAQIPAEPSSRPRSPSQTRSQASEDSQTVLLSHSDAKAAQSSSQTSHENKEASEEDILHCWICLVDEPAAKPEAQDWKAPCSCNLTAHEECLFQWIASQKEDKVYCPQCKTQIKIAQPRNYSLSFMRKMIKIADWCLLPGSITTICGITYSGLFVYGANAVTLVCGSQDILNISQPNTMNTGKYGLILSFLRITAPFFPQGAMDGKYLILLPLIAPTLILSRYKIADNVFTLLLPAYCALQLIAKPSSSTMHLQWPPSPGLTLATLPYFRAFYNESYKYLFQELETQWDQAVQRKPREGETVEDVAREAAEAGGGQMDIDIGIDIIAVEDDRAAFEEEVQELRQEIQQELLEVAGEGAAPANEAEAPAEAPAGQNVDAAARQQEVVNRNVAVWERRLNAVSGETFVTTIFGALFFPAISYAMGNLLKHTLPISWIKPPYRFTWGKKLSWSEGFLQSQFGRSIAGGCLFVVLKDAVWLYYKWQRAKNYSKRRILNHKEYEYKNGEV